MKVGFLVVLAMAGAFYLPRVLVDTQAPETEANQTASYASTDDSGPKIARAFQDNRGHYSFDTRMNGKSVKVLVDTGASAVAINETTARRIGLKGRGRGNVRVSTANGTLDAKRHTIREIRIGKVRVRNVNALILPDHALKGTLLGMSFLKKLKRFEFNDRTLTIVQGG